MGSGSDWGFFFNFPGKNGFGLVWVLKKNKFGIILRIFEMMGWIGGFGFEKFFMSDFFSCQIYLRKNMKFNMES